MKLSWILQAALLVSASCAQAQPGDALTHQLERLAERGNGEALYHLGMAYWTGEGVRGDDKKALEYFRRAAAAGDPLGSYKLGCIYDGQRNVLERDAAKALEFKLVAADAGYALAQQDVASLYAEKAEPGTALGWLKKAAIQGTSGALLTYASIHNGAKGVVPDPVITAAYFRLYLKRADATDQQRKWLEEFEAKLSPEQVKAAHQLVAAYRPTPTPLTLKALSGVKAAQALIAQN